MNIKKKTLKILLATAMTLVMSLAGIMTNAKAAPAVPKLQMITPSAAEYHLGDRVSFTVASPNYKGKVEYRVILYNGTTKKTSELWPSMPGYYYKGWQPAGNYNFTINWPVSGMEPGAYSLTVLVRRVGAKVAYDSFVKTNTFWIKTEDNAAATLLETAANELLQKEPDKKEETPSNTTPSETASQEVPPAEGTTNSEEGKLSKTYYENSEGKYKIRLPEYWNVIEDNKDNISTVMAAPIDIDDEASAIIITAGSGIKGISFDTAKEIMFGSYVKILAEGKDSWKEVSSKKVNISDKEAYFCEYSSNEEVSGVKVSLNYYMLFTMANNHVYFVTAVADSEIWESEKSLLEQSLMSLIPFESTT